MRFRWLSAAFVAAGLVPSAVVAQSDAELDFLFGTESESPAPSPAPAAAEADVAPAPEAAVTEPASAAEPVADTVAVEPLRSEQQDTLQEPAARPRSRLVEEIVVTAQKREENIQDVPITISAFSGAALDAKGIGTAQALAQSIPGVTYGESVNFSIIYVRGVGTEAFLPDSDLSVAMYLDGIYFPFANGLSQSFGAVERVEVLKGPQGTLFGRNSTGGAFSITSRKPEFEPEGSFAVGYNSLDQWQTRAYGNLPITDTFAANVSLTYNPGENYYEGTRGVVGGGVEPLPKEVERGARVRLRWNPSDWMDMTLTGIKHSKTGMASTAMPNVHPSTLTRLLAGLTGNGDSLDRSNEYSVNVDIPGYFSLDSEVVYGQIDLSPDWFNVKLLVGQQDILTDNYYDFDGSRAPFITFDARGQFADIFTAEVQFISNGEWGPDWLEWVGGIFYLDQSSGFPKNRLSVGDLDLSSGTILGLIPIPPALSNLLTRIGNQIGVIPDGVSLGLVSLLDTESTAYFGQATTHFTDWMHLTLGGRYQTETRSVVESSVGTVGIDGSVTTLLQFRRPVQDSSNFSPRVVLGFTPWDETLLYGSWSKGFKSGTFNTVNVYTNPAYVEPEEVTTYELGVKTDFWDRQLRFNGAAFQNQIKNQQVQVISLLAGGAVALENAGEVKINGAEFDLTYNPHWNDGLVVSLSLTWLDAKYESYTGASSFIDVSAGSILDSVGLGRLNGLLGSIGLDALTETSVIEGIYNFGTGDYTGNRTVRTPEWSGNLGFNQIIGLGNGDLEIGASLFYSSDMYFQAQNHAKAYQDAYYVVDAQISYLHNPSNVRVTVLGKNLNDARYAMTQFHTDAGVQEYLAPPRHWGVRLDWTFGGA